MGKVMELVACGYGEVMYGGIGSKWNEQTEISLLSWKSRIFRLF